MEVKKVDVFERVGKLNTIIHPCCFEFLDVNCFILSIIKPLSLLCKISSSHHRFCPPPNCLSSPLTISSYILFLPRSACNITSSSSQSAKNLANQPKTFLSSICKISNKTMMFVLSMPLRYASNKLPPLFKNNSWFPLTLFNFSLHICTVRQSFNCIIRESVISSILYCFNMYKIRVKHV